MMLYLRSSTGLSLNSYYLSIREAPGAGRPLKRMDECTTDTDVCLDTGSGYNISLLFVHEIVVSLNVMG